MRIVAKFNLMMLGVFIVGLVAICVVSFTLLQNNAEQQVIQNARIMLETARAMRRYTANQIEPLLASQMKARFMPQSVPAYAATESFNDLHQRYPQYAYKEATLNPTNPRDRATDWEADVVNYFRNHTDKTEMIGTREAATGESLYLSVPIKVDSPKCLTCHSSPATAPPSQVRLYGPSNGFGWQKNEIVGAQIVSVPTSLSHMMAVNAFGALLGSLIALFVVTLIVLNWMLRILIIRPIVRLSKTADAISTGNVDVAELPAHGSDEISILAQSFNRMQRSIKMAISMLEDKPL